MSRRTWQDGLFRGKSLDGSKSARGGSSVGRRCGHRERVLSSTNANVRIWIEQHREAFRDESQPSNPCSKLLPERSSRALAESHVLTLG